jgi:hypothetical protein
MTDTNPPELVEPPQPVGATAEQLQGIAERARLAQQAINDAGMGAPEPTTFLWRGSRVSSASVTAVLDAAAEWHAAPFGHDTVQSVALIDALEQLELEL